METAVESCALDRLPPDSFIRRKQCSPLPKTWSGFQQCNDGSTGKRKHGRNPSTDVGEKDAAAFKKGKDSGDESGGGKDLTAHLELALGLLLLTGQQGSVDPAQAAVIESMGDADPRFGLPRPKLISQHKEMTRDDVGSDLPVRWEASMMMVMRCFGRWAVLESDQAAV
jgi:hypothetical protein